MFRAYPAADSYREVVRSVDVQSYASIRQATPFRTHAKEFEANRLYVALRGRLPLGLLHVRHEETDWGLSEIVWHVDLDLSVDGFRFQRSRSRHASLVESSPFARSLIGKRAPQLIKLLERSRPPSRPIRRAPLDHTTLQHIILQSGIKTLTALRIVWSEELGKLRAVRLGALTYPTAARIIALPAADPDQNGLLNHPVRVLHASRAYNERDRLLGTVAHVQSQVAGHAIDLHWSINPAGKTESISVLSRDLPPALHASISALRDQPILAVPPSSPLHTIARCLGQQLHVLDLVGPPR